MSTQALADQDVVGAQRPLSILLYSSDALTRQAVRTAVGRRPAPDVSAVTWRELATPDAVVAAVDTEFFDLVILDGEASPLGGMGLCKRLKDEVEDCPDVLVLIGRPQDAWLATWSRADYVVSQPLDPLAVARAVAHLLRAAPSADED
jgi:DNA-binding response OmpR family regulator